MATTTLQELLLYFIAFIVVFLIGRFVMLWYYKIDERIELQKETNNLLRIIAGEKATIGTANTTTNQAVSDMYSVKREDLQKTLDNIGKENK